MQYIFPAQQDLRKLLYFYDDATPLNFASMAALKDTIRSTRATVKSQSGSTLVTHRMMGAVAGVAGGTQRVHFARISFLSEDPDFTTDKRFIQTMLHPGRGLNPRTEIDFLENSIPFPQGAAGEREGPIWVRPAYVGAYAFTNTTMTFPKLTSQASKQSLQYAAAWTHWHREFTPSGPTEATSTIASWAYNDNNSINIFAPTYTNGTTVAFKWSPSFLISGQNRITTPTRSDTSTYANAVSSDFAFSGGVESAIKLTKGLLVVDEGPTLRAVVLSSADGDFAHGNTLAGMNATVTSVKEFSLYARNQFAL
ncbi:hypothetical protein MPK67_gp093 [Erwinia phage pEa_SNUABM_32]|uniref:Uncharacterized protein n=1 Tax=Erwinia phage pEa_SNUABM_32 TaxID=2869555 RepID=A0AAE8C0T8_9CAUD|nr:hypothetical protein MPK67_gp093 [Erwinia phage pEa_SNUABM_32]QZE56629.1 hypothetical protein pEaSNUABM20_00093 [Erwinia phage pEa_SNUABM_20]QZE56966.1 hypothetical protein pEaSNUABM32_00093 [Erwinia phage pEa_SNUABM_32]